MFSVRLLTHVLVVKPVRLIKNRPVFLQLKRSLTLSAMATQHKDVSSLTNDKGEFVRNASSFRNQIEGEKCFTGWPWTLSNKFWAGLHRLP